ncbi:hypothetical protein D1007_37368 [Hordeum vulgare]|nr:hypothetical protein D1007_37368 [Hordeum vulgare]
MRGTVFPTCSNEEHSQGGRSVIDVAASFMQGFVDGSNNGYYLDIFFDWGTIVHNYYSHVVQVIHDSGYHHDFELVKDHRVQWDLGSYRWRRLEVKPNFKEGVMSRPSPSPSVYMGLHRNITWV